MSKSLRRLALAASITVAGVAHAAPFTGQGVPSDPAAGIIHIDAEAAGSSTLYKALRQIGEAIVAKNPAQKAAGEKMNAEIGWTEKSTRDVTMLLYAPKLRQTKCLASSASPTGSLTARSSLRSWRRIRKWSRTSSARTLGSPCPDLQKAFGAFAEDPAEGFSFRVLPRPGGRRRHCHGLHARTARARSHRPRHQSRVDDEVRRTTAALTSDKNAVISVYLPESFFKGMAPADTKKPGDPELKSVAFTLAEAAGNLQVHADARTDSAKTAQQFQAQGSLYLAMALMLLGQEKPGESDSDKADKAFFLSAIQALKLGSSGDALTVDFAYPADKLAEKLHEKQGDIIAAIKRQERAGSAVKGSAHKPAAVTPVPVAGE